MALEHWQFGQNVRKNKALLKALAELLKNEISKRNAASKPAYLDFRFLIPVAQWMVEQGGYTITPQGNNPGNVMGTGDAGTFHRAKNHEVIGGKSVLKPADFAKFSTMEVGTAVTFNHLKEYWFGAYNQILTGGSSNLYVAGLYPGAPKNYATALQADYTSGIRFRLSQAIEDFILIVKDDIKELDNEISMSPSEFGSPTVFGGIQKDENQKQEKVKLEEQLKELLQIQTRHKKGESLQP